MPTGWRAELKRVADAYVAGEVPEGDGIERPDVRSFEISRANLADYGEPMGPLAEVAWESSVMAWQGGYWQVLVDLTDLNGERSDLALHARVTPVGDGVLIEPGLVYVP